MAEVYLMNLRQIARLAFLLVCVSLTAGGASADDIPDPCKLLSAKEIQDKLGTTGPVLLKTIPEAGSRSKIRIVDTGFGDVGVSFPLTDLGEEKKDLFCRGRAGDVDLWIRVRPISLARADEKERRTQLALMQKKYGYKTEFTSFGATTCEETRAPAQDLYPLPPLFADMIARGTRCSQTRGELQLLIGVAAWRQRDNLPFPVASVSQLVAKAASRN